MDGYPIGSLDHNVPLLVASGLLSTPPKDLPLSSELNDQAVLIRSDIPALENKEAKVLVRYLDGIDSRQDAWNPGGQGGGYKFRVVTAGRSYLLPPRRARLPSHVEPPSTPAVLHSPFSPLSPTSPLYPDGIMNAQWLLKHQELVPGIFALFYSLTSDLAHSAAEDNKLKADIGNIRSALAKSGYRTRLVIVLLGERQASPFHENIHERIDNIRRGAGLDPKTVFYVPPQDSPRELVEAVDGILASAYVLAQEYYREMGRHARKKRSRGTAPQPTVPPTSGTSQTLSLPGWHVRYDFKSAVFAEFRREMDTALRAFEQCYETLMGPDLADVIPSWSPRWNEARLLADIVATRCLRCLLWAGQTSTAVRRWREHRGRIRELVEQRGRGTSNYGWKAWEARWTMVMAQLVDRVELQPFAPPQLALYIPPEKAMLGERVEPWEMLHHTGYWYKAAAEHIAARRDLAHAIPDEDRHAPDSSPASRVANKAYTYDTYLCPEPHEEYPLGKDGFDHAQLIVHCLMEARVQFQARGQSRAVCELALRAAGEMLRTNAYDEVVAILRPLWEDMLFRSDGWWPVVEEVNWTLRTAAARAGRGDLVLAIDWELLDRKFTRRRDWHYDLSRSLENHRPSGDEKTVARIDDSMRASFVSASFAFRSKEGRSGEVCRAQLAITSHAFPDSVPITLRRLSIEFTGGLRTVVVRHGGPADGGGRNEAVDFRLVQVALENAASGRDEEGEEEEDDDESVVLQGTGDLTLDPGRTSVYELDIPLREPGPAGAVAVTLSFETETFEIHHPVTFEGVHGGDVWYGRPPRRLVPLRPDAHTLDVQPRPPKLEIRNVQVERQFYANEAIRIPLEILNAEEDAVEARLAVFLFGEPPQAFRVRLGDAEKTATTSPDGSVVSSLPMHTVGAGAASRVVIALNAVQGPANYDVTTKVSYHLLCDPATPIIQSTTFRLAVVNAFEASFDMLPRLHPDPWPSLFDVEDAQDPSGETPQPPPQPPQPTGLVQKWCLHCHYASFASDDLVILGTDVRIVACAGGTSTVTSSRPAIPEEGLAVAPRTPREAQFDIAVQKASLDDRGPASLDVAFVIRWRRTEPSSGSPASSSPTPVNTTSILAPQRYVVLGTEPRVLASVVSIHPKTGLAALDVTIENGSSHFLTFGVSMEPSDEFAFSGPKQTTIHVLPVSRRTVSYRIVPLARGKFVRLPLAVRDKYYQRVLSVQPTEGMRADKEGLYVWISPMEEGEGDETASGASGTGPENADNATA